MGNYLNSKTAYDSYNEICRSNYYVDKSLLLQEISERIGISEKYICITRPRRFGKSIMANMIASFYSKGCNSSEIFGKLKIAQNKKCYRDNIIDISFVIMGSVVAAFLVDGMIMLIGRIKLVGR
jgi:hypothetical protein